VLCPRASGWRTRRGGAQPHDRGKFPGFWLGRELRLARNLSVRLVADCPPPRFTPPSSASVEVQSRFAA
jgi:hypothetical protein